MIARIYDKDREKYYISEVYGILNCGVDMYIVDSIENNSERVTLVPYLDFSSNPPHDVLVERINANETQQPWIYVSQDGMREFNEQLNGRKPCHYFRGYKCIWEQKIRLVDLYLNGDILKEELVKIPISTKLKGWNYVETQEDINMLMDYFAGFHDSVIKEVHYISGDYRLPDGRMLFTETHEKTIQMIFDSDWSGSIEIVFEAPRIMQLVPPAENYLSGLYEASIFIREYIIYFYDSYIESITENYSGTFIKTMGMRWRNI